MQFLLKYLSLILVFITVLHFAVLADEKEYFDVAVGQTHTYFVDENEGSSYYWTVFSDPEFVVSAPETDVFFPGGNTGHAVDIEWRKEGLFFLTLAEYDLSGCMNLKVKAVHVNPGGFAVNVGNDTIIGKCHPFQLKVKVPDQEGVSYTFRWEPSEHLDNPFSASPVFTPGTSTRFTVNVTSNRGISATGTVRINVSEVLANAGPDVFAYSGETAEINGSDSRGEGLTYQWTSENGTVLSGEETANPVVQGAGLYLLTVTDRFGCEDTDTVTLGLLTREPVVSDDFDTTGYRRELMIRILENDYDPDNVIDPASLRISVSPLYGTASIDLINHTVLYTPGRNFSGADELRYQVCDRSGNCYEASVFIWVDDIRFFIPEAFSPNNDGINDYFEIPGIEYYDNNFIEIFNRWGNMVYRAEKYGIETYPVYWDGKSNTGIRLGNESLPSGSYFYVIELGNGEKRILGSVYLDR